MITFNDGIKKYKTHMFDRFKYVDFKTNDLMKAYDKYDESFLRIKSFHVYHLCSLYGNNCFVSYKQNPLSAKKKKRKAPSRHKTLLQARALLQKFKRA